MAVKGGEDSYEVWTERLHGKWSAVTDEEGGTIKLFGSQKEARQAAVAFANDGTVIRALVFRRIVVESINCAGVHAAKMGLNKPGVHIDGLQLGPKPPPSFIAKAREKKEESK